MPTPELVSWGSFRTHILLAHDLVTAIKYDEPSSGLTRVDDTYYRKDTAVLKVRRLEGRVFLHVQIQALKDVWVQEPGLTVMVAGTGTWRGYGPSGAWTSKLYTMTGNDPHRSTVHFSRVKSSPDFTAGVEYAQGAVKWRIGSDGGFTALLDRPYEQVPWKGCQVFGQDYDLTGVILEANAVLRRWELAGGKYLKNVPKSTTQMHYVGWAGGAGAVTDEHGRTPSPGEVLKGTEFSYLWNLRSWRRLKKGSVIKQTLSRRVSSGPA